MLTRAGWAGTAGRATAASSKVSKKHKAQMWISHDAATNATLKKAPEFYE